MFKYTIQRWLSPKGNWINEKGVTPDVKVELSDEEVWRLGLDDFPYIEEEFENIKDDDDIIGFAITKEDNKIIKFPISTDEKNMQDRKCDYKLLSTKLYTALILKIVFF